MDPTVAVARLSLRDLTDDELLALNTSVQSDFGDPRQRAGYGKVAHLFTLANGTRADGPIKDAFAAEVLARYPEYRKS